MLALIGGAVGAAVGQDADFDGSGSVNFNDPTQWSNPGQPGGYPDLGGGIIDFTGGDADVTVDEDVTNIGGFSNSGAGNVVFNGDGTFSFNDGAAIDPGSGTFTFGIDLTAIGDLTFALLDGDVTFDGAFDALGGGTILANDGTVQFNGAVTSGAGTIWQANLGGFTFDGDFGATGDQTFAGLSGTNTDDVFSFNGAATFTATDDGTNPNDSTLSFNQSSVLFSGGLVLEDSGVGGSNFILNLDGDGLGGNGVIMSIAGLQVNTQGLTFNIGDGSLVEINGTTDFNGAITDLTIVGMAADSGGGVSFSGQQTFAGDLNLTVDGDQTVDFTGTTVLGGDLYIDTLDGAEGGPGGNATIEIGGNIDLVAGLDELDIFISTDGTNDNVSISGGALRGITSNITIKKASALRFSDGSAGDGNTNVLMAANSTMFLGTVDGLANEFLFESLNDLNAAAGVGAVELDGDTDASMFVRNGTFSGTFADTGNGDLSLAWTQNETRFLGSADIDGAYQARNEALHYLGLYDETVPADSIRATVSSISAFDVIQGTAYLEYADVSTAADGTLNLSSGATAAAMLIIENDSTLTVGSDFTMDAESMLMITGDSTAGVNLDVGGLSAIDGTIEITATSDGTTANASFADATVLNGVLNQNSTSYVDFGGALAIQQGGQWRLEETATGDVDGDLTVAGLLSLEGDAATGLMVGDSVTISDGGQIQVIGDRTMNVAFDFTVETGGALLFEDSAALVVGRDFTGRGTIQFRNSSGVDVIGTWTQESGTAVFDGPAMFDVGALVIQDGASIELRDSGGSTTAVVVGNGDVDIEAGGLLFGNGTIDITMGDLEYAGVLMAGANGASEGRLEILNGNLVSEDGGELRFGLTGGMAGTIGESSLISVVNGVADFSNSGSLVVDVIGASYIPTDQTFTLVEATGFINEDNIDLEAGAPSVTRSWNWGIDTLGMLGNRVFAQSDADYTNTLTGEQIRIGDLLNSFIPNANVDPTGAYGTLLGELDQIQTAAAYAAAIQGLEPTAQISAIQVSALGQYHEVLRRELRQQYVQAERRTPTPFRLGDPTQLLADDDTTMQRSVRRAADTDSTARGFGAFWGRNLRTPTEGDVVGLDGNEFGGFGAFAWDLSDAWIAGVDLGYSAFTGSLDGGYGNTRIGTVRGGGFASWSDGSGLFFDGALSGAWNHYQFTRLVPGTSLSAESNADGWQIDASFGGGYQIALQEGFAFTPQASFLYSYINTGQIDENSSSVAALSIDPGELSSFIGRVGAGVSWSALPGLVFDGELGWQGNFTDNGDYAVGLSGLGADVPVEVKNQTINTAYYGAGVSWTPTSNIAVNLNWQGRSGDGLTSQMLFGGFSISF